MMYLNDADLSVYGSCSSTDDFFSGNAWASARFASSLVL